MSDNQKNRDRSRTDDNELDEEMTYNDKNRYMSEKGIDSSAGLQEREVGGQGGRMMHQGDQDRDRNNQSGQRDRTTSQSGGQGDRDRDRSGSQSGSGQGDRDRDRGSQSGRDNKKGGGRG